MNPKSSTLSGSALLAALLLSGCAALNQPRPPMPEWGASAKPSNDALVTACAPLWGQGLTTDQARTCASSLRRAYMDHDFALSRGQGNFDRSLLATAVAGVATATFGAHPDTTAALGLLGGTLGSVRGYYNVNGRVQAMAIGRTGMNCILESSAAMQVQKVRLDTLLNTATSQLEVAMAPRAASTDVEPESVAAERAVLLNQLDARVNAIAAIALSGGSRPNPAAPPATKNQATDDPHAELIRQAIHRVSEQVIAAYTFGAVDFTNSGTQIREAVDDALEIAELGEGVPLKAAAVVNQVQRSSLMLVVDTARLNACGRSGD